MKKVCYYQGKATVTFFPLLHVQVTATRSTIQGTWRGDIEKTHSSATTQTYLEIITTATAEHLPRYKSGEKKKPQNKQTKKTKTIHTHLVKSNFRHKLYL